MSDSSLPTTEVLAAGLSRHITRLEHARVGPLGSIYHAIAVDELALAVHIIPRQLVQLAVSPTVLCDTLRELRNPSDRTPFYRWVELTIDGDLCCALPWVESIAFVGLARAARSERHRLTLAAHDLCYELDQWHQTGVIHGVIAPMLLRVDHTYTTLFLDGMGVFSALIAAGAKAGDVVSLLPVSPYASPELIDGDVYDRRADIYALGATLYEIFTGRAPFGGRATTRIMASVLIERADETASGADILVGTVITALLRAIEKSRDDRWENIRTFGDALLGHVVVAPSPQISVSANRLGCSTILLLACALFAASTRFI